MRCMTDYGINCQIHYKALNNQDIDNIVSIPLYYSMTDIEIDYVIKYVNKYCNVF